MIMKEKLTALFIGIRYDHLKHESGDVSDQDWLQHIYHGTSNMSLQYCVNSQNPYGIFVPFKDTLVVNLIALELMAHVAIPYTWKEFLCYIEGAHLMPLQSSNQDTSLEVAKA